jgi:hypothetical protein
VIGTDTDHHRRESTRRELTRRELIERFSMLSDALEAARLHGDEQLCRIHRMRIANLHRVAAAAGLNLLTP